MKIHIPKLFYIVAFIFLIIAIFKGEYLFEIFASFFVLLILFALFYRENEPPVIFAALVMQWLSISIGHFYVLFSDVQLEQLLWRPIYSLNDINYAYWYSIIGLLAFSVGVKVATQNLKTVQISEELLKKYSTTKLIIAYVVVSITLEPISNALRFVIPALYQFLKTLAFFKWSFFFLMIYVSFKRNEMKSIVFFIIIIEIILGFTGYFSDFKTYLILFPIVYLSFNKFQGTKQISLLLLIAVTAITLGGVWSYVKMDYRMFLSGGERAQKVTVEKQAALQKLWELTSDMNTEKFSVGFEGMIKRVYFLEYFSATIRYVPEYMPYLDGETWNKSFQHIFMPRMFFPNKEAIDDSKQTYKLTGIQVADASLGTSISVGYMAESYADFGPFYMHFAIFFLGLLIGFIYKGLLKNSFNQLWGFALIFPMFFLFNINGKNLIKIFGDSTYFLIVFFLIKKFAIPRLNKFILNKNAQ